MRGSKRLGLAFILVTLVALLAAGLFAELGGSAGATSTAPDTIIYSQQNGSKGQYLQYVPGDNSKPTTQSVTGAGGCATPNTASQPILAFSAKNYPNGYGGASQAAIVGAYNSRTGVCATPQAWSIEVNEELIFAPGPNSLTNGRVFSSASLFLEREDKTGGTLTGQLLAKLNGQVQKTIPFS
ncbi:MAG TPA: hypothetical protein VL856_00075, partial [Acidimicrobiia bacterium]|nr:hypothetical protein [Acidimicrobiia bacterium]